MRFVFIAGIAGALSAACTPPTNSSTLNTNQIAAALSVTADNTGETVAEAVLTDSSNSNSVALSSGDSLSVAVSGVTGTTALASSSSLLGGTSYQATLDTDSLGPYTIAFTRPSGKTSTNWAVTLPPPFTISAPISGSTYSVSMSSIPLEWDTAPVVGETMSWSASGTCITAVSSEQIPVEAGEDQTGYAIEPGTLTIATSSSTTGSTTTSETCSVTITLVGELPGPLPDPDYASGSSIYGVQTASATITVTP